MSGTPTVLRKVNGVVPASAGATPQVAAATASQKSSKSKAPVEGQKVVIRRLAPGLTEDEFIALLPNEWKPGNGKVGWFSYHTGKISRDPAKPSLPSRAYLHVLRTEAIMALSEVVRTTEWEDAKETFNDASLITPPVVELSIYKKVPSTKVRTDTRQGTIDQDPDFMDFLEALANPAPNKDPEVDYTADDEEKPTSKVSSTPLIDYLREKKASKAKEAASAKAAKHSRHESQTVKGKGGDEPKKKTRDARDHKSDRPRETVKILTKKAATAAAAAAANAVASQITATDASKEETSKNNRRAGIAAAARILQRDLGLSPGNAHRRARQEAAKAAPEPAKDSGPASPSTTAPAPASVKDRAKSAGVAPAPAEEATAISQPPTPTAPKAAASSSSRGSRAKKGNAPSDGQKTKEKRTPVEKPGEASSAVQKPPAAPKIPVTILKKKEEPPSSAAAATPAEQSADAVTPTVAAAKPPPSGPRPSQTGGGKGGSTGAGSQKKGGSVSSATVNANATRAFVKHANPSQGVTEATLKEAMQTFGVVTFVEIDRRKGFAYVDFADHESLVKAIAATPVSVAQAAVQVLERKDTGKKAAPAAAAAASISSASNAVTANGGEGSGRGAGRGGAPVAAPPSTTPKASSASKLEPAGASSSTPPSGPAADKARSTDPKRGGRRRGGRGRGGDAQPKEGQSGSGGSKPPTSASASAAAPT